MGDAAGVGNARPVGERGPTPSSTSPLAVPARLALLDERADTFGGIVAQHVSRDRTARGRVGLREAGLDLLVEERLPRRAYGGGLLDDRGGEPLHFGVELRGRDD